MERSGSTSSGRPSGSEVERYYLEDDRPFQLVVRTKPRRVVFFRAKPITAYEPTPAQIRARIAFGEAARRARGMKMVPGQLPPAAIAVKEAMSGRSFGGEPRRPKWLRVLERLAESLAK
jgi:hypothetical protein